MPADSAPPLRHDACAFCTHPESPMLRRFACPLIALVLAGCAASQPSPFVTLRTPFVAAEHAPFKAAGTASITGQAFLRQRGGGTVTCAGSKVYLFPDSPYFTEMVDVVRAGKLPATPASGDAEYKGIARQTQCDAQGNFNFEQLPPLSWYVMTEVTWMVGNNQEGGSLLRLVELASGQSTRVLLSNSDRVGR